MQQKIGRCLHRASFLFFKLRGTSNEPALGNWPERPPQIDANPLGSKALILIEFSILGRPLQQDMESLL